MLLCPTTGRECQFSGCTTGVKSCDYWPKAIPTNDRYLEGFKAGREAGMREAAAIVGTLAERPYDSMPEFAAITHAESAILSAMKEGK